MLQFRDRMYVVFVIYEEGELLSIKKVREERGKEVKGKEENGERIQTERKRERIKRKKVEKQRKFCLVVIV